MYVNQTAWIENKMARCIKFMLESRNTTTGLRDVCSIVTVRKGCLQGGVVSPLLCLVIDETLVTLNRHGTY